MRTKNCVAALLAIGALAVPAVASATQPRPVVAAPAPPQEFAPGDATFFDIPDPIPAGTHGDLIRWQFVDTPFQLTYRIMYLSETVAGAPTVVTGLVAAPDEAPPFGGFPLLVHGHGSLGLADACAPSRAIDAADSANAEEFDGLGTTATSDGFIVASSDFEGIGGPGRHPFFVGLSEGRSMLDAGLAARQLPVLYVGAPTTIAGFSQGGHAALWATQLAPEWTPQHLIMGTVVVAAGSEVSDLARAGFADPALGLLPAAMVAGLAAISPDAEAALALMLTPSGRELVALLDESCFQDDVTWPEPPYLTADPTTVEPYASLFAANTAGTAASATPILMFHGDADTNIPLAQSDALLDRLCAAGQVVERRILVGANHLVTNSQSRQEFLTWLLGLTTGAAPISSCLR